MKGKTYHIKRERIIMKKLNVLALLIIGGLVYKAGRKDGNQEGYEAGWSRGWDQGVNTLVDIVMKEANKEKSEG